MTLSDLTLANLTPSERGLAYLICEEALLVKQIAPRMHLTESTVKRYTTLLYRKVNAHSAVELTIWYWKQRVAALEQSLNETERELISGAR